MMDNKCFICGRLGEYPLELTVDNGGKIHEKIETEQSFLCKIHWKEYQAIKKKRRPKDDFN